MSQHLEWEEWVSGLGAGLSNVTLTFPIHKLMFRQMLDGVTTRKSFIQLKTEGISLLYRGLLPPLCQKTVSVSIMFGSYDYYSTILIKYGKITNEQLAKSSGAVLAGVTEAFLAPLERIQTLLQDKHYHKKFSNTKHAIKHLWNHYNLKEFYRGGSTIVFRNSVANVLFFASREHIQRNSETPNSRFSKYLFDFIVGGVIGGGISSVMYPVNVVKTRMQTTMGGSFEDPLRVFLMLVKERGGFIGLYRGVHLNYIRSLLSWGIINASYELIRSLLFQIQGKNDI